jgi:hypothetical protein
MISRVSEEVDTLSGEQAPRRPHLHRHHRRRRFRVRPEALGQGDGIYSPTPVVTLAPSVTSIGRETTPQLAQVSRPEAAKASEQTGERRTGGKGIRITLVMLLLIFICTYLRQIWRLLQLVALAWPDWLRHWPSGKFWPF